MDLAKKPDASVRPVSLGGHLGDFQHLSCLLKSQTGEVSQFHQIGFGRVLDGEFRQCLIQRNQILRRAFMARLCSKCTVQFAVALLKECCSCKMSLDRWKYTFHKHVAKDDDAILMDLLTDGDPVTRHTSLSLISKGRSAECRIHR